MSTNIHLSKRLKTVASYVSPHVKMADIGSDHAYLPCYLCERDEHIRAIAGEINEGPFKSAEATVRANNLEKRVSVRLGNGLSVFEAGEVEEVVIAGMGGSLIAAILEQDKARLQGVNRLILQPNIDEDDVRIWLDDNQFEIIEEAILEEKGHLYEIIVAERSAKDIRQLTDKEKLLGPILLQEKSTVFLKKWQHIYQKRQQILKQLEQAQDSGDKKIKLSRELIWIKEALGIDNE